MRRGNDGNGKPDEKLFHDELELVNIFCYLGTS